MKKILFLIIVILFSRTVFAETITLKSGQVITGEITGRMEDEVKISMEAGIEATYYLDEIERINGELLQAPEEDVSEFREITIVEEVVIAEPIEEVKRAEEIEKVEEAESEVESESLIVESPKAPVVAEEVEEPVNDRLIEYEDEMDDFIAEANNRKEAARALSLAASEKRPSGMVIFLSIVFWIVQTIALYMIAQKIGSYHAWWVFIPILNVLILFELAHISKWFVFLFLLPFINVFLFVFIWVRIAAYRNRPAWVGLLILVPFVNFVMPLYLGFSKEEMTPAAEEGEEGEGKKEQ